MEGSNINKKGIPNNTKKKNQLKEWSLTMELFILIGGCYALYTVGMAIATQLDYMEVERERKKDSLESGTH